MKHKGHFLQESNHTFLPHDSFTIKLPSNFFLFILIRKLYPLVHIQNLLIRI